MSEIAPRIPSVTLLQLGCFYDQASDVHKFFSPATLRARSALSRMETFRSPPGGMSYKVRSLPIEATYSVSHPLADSIAISADSMRLPASLAHSEVGRLLAWLAPFWCDQRSDCRYTRQQANSQSYLRVLRSKPSPEQLGLALCNPAAALRGGA